MMIEGTAQDWRVLASCREVDPEAFFPVGNDWEGPGNAARAEAAKAVCARCPVLESCAWYALDSGDNWAILAGTTPSERRTLRRALPERVPA